MIDFNTQNAIRLLDDIAENSYRVGPVVRWKSNNAVIPPCVLEDALLVPWAEQVAMYEKEATAWIARYRKAQANRSAEEIAEEKAEIRAAFGPGEIVVNILTGEEILT